MGRQESESPVKPTGKPGKAAGAEEPIASDSEPPSHADLRQKNKALQEEVAALRAQLASNRRLSESEPTDPAPREAAAWEEFHYRTLFHNANDAVFVYHLTPEGKPTCFVEVNRVACERYGYTREELTRMAPADIVDPVTTSVNGKIQELRENGTLITESVHRTRDGERIISEVSAHLFEMNGRPTVLSICRDITERKRAEQKLYETNEALDHSLVRRAAVMDSALDGIVTMDHQGRIVEFNAAAERILGHERQEVIGKSLSETIVPPRLREAHRRGMDRFLATNQSEILNRRVEMPVLHADGHEIPMELVIACTWLDDQPFFTGYLRDITERKQAEKKQMKLLEREQAARAEAEASEERMTFLAEASIVLAASLDYEKTLQRVADLAVPHLADWCAITMFDPKAATEEAPEKAFQQMAVAHQDPEKVAWARELRERYPPDPNAPKGSPHVIRTGEAEFYPEVHKEQLTAVARDDEHLKLLQKVGFRSAIIVPMKVYGEAIGAITFVWSDTEKHYTESDLRLAEELARRAALEVNNARLYEKLKKLYREAKEARWQAEEMNRLKSAFLANMSHEIRTPLTNMIGYASLLTKRLSDKEYEYAHSITSGGRRLMDTLDSVLNLSQLEANQASLQLEVLNVAEETRQTLALMKKEVRRKGLALTLHVAPSADEACAYLDRGAFNSILQNLVGNAVKFTDQGEISVILEKDSECINVYVKDTGRGIDEVFLPHLFEPFQQESKGWDRSYEGAGLGLPLTKQLVEIMDGQIDVESEKGVGSRFTVTFPTASAKEEGDAPVESPASGLQRETRKASPQLLVVEDNDDTRFLIQTLVDSLGEVRAVATAEAALEEAQKRSRSDSEAEASDRPHPFDLCLIDINLGPGKSGTDLMKELRAMPTYQNTPLVAVTGYALPGDRERLLAMSFDAYLAKPFDPEELLDLSSRLLGQ